MSRPSKKPPPAIGSSVQGTVDTTYHTQQRDLFTSGLAAQIGTNAFAVWHAIKSHSDFETGECWPGVRTLMRLTGASSHTVQDALTTLKENHLLRVARIEGQRHVYVARERMDVRVGNRVICTIVMDYVPSSMRERLAVLKTKGMDLDGEDVWSDLEILPGPGIALDTAKGIMKGRLRADEVPVAEEGALPPSMPSMTPTALEHRQRARELADDLRLAPKVVHKGTEDR